MNEHEIRKRVTTQIRRKFIYKFHQMLTVLLALPVILYLLGLPGRYPWYEPEMFRRDLVLVSLVGMIPLLMHHLWLRYHAELDTELEKHLAGHKTKNNAFDFTHLQTEDEFIPEEADESDSLSRYKSR